MFWGELTPDNSKRSFGGYGRDLNKCERYTKGDVNASGYNFPFYEEGMEWNRFDDYAIKFSDLEKLGKSMAVIFI